MSNLSKHYPKPGNLSASKVSFEAKKIKPKGIIKKLLGIR